MTLHVLHVLYVILACLSFRSVKSVETKIPTLANISIFLYLTVLQSYKSFYKDTNVTNVLKKVTT